MKITSTNKDDRLAEVQGYYNRASTSASTQRALFNKYDKQYRGSHEIDAKGDGDKLPEDAEVVWNISFELLEGSIDTDIPQPFITPELKCEHHVRNARRIENLIRMLQDKQPFEVINDQQERTCKKMGTSATNVEWDVDTGTHSTIGEAQVTPLRPQNIYPQPGITRIEYCDYVFVDYITTREEIKRIQHETGITTVFVTHDQDEAMSISDIKIAEAEELAKIKGISEKDAKNIYEYYRNIGKES